LADLFLDFLINNYVILFRIKCILMVHDVHLRML
jgi:hypothetical protein